MNLNQVNLVGRVVNTPEIKQTKNGKTMAKFSLATNFNKYTEFHKVVVFGNYAEVVKQYVYKGRLLLVQGRLHTSFWENEKNEKRSTTEIVVQTLGLLDKHQALVDAVSEDETVVTEAIPELAAEMVAA